jgi:hypothetical protein
LLTRHKFSRCCISSKMCAFLPENGCSSIFPPSESSRGRELHWHRRFVVIDAPRDHRSHSCGRVSWHVRSASLSISCLKVVFVLPVRTRPWPLNLVLFDDNHQSSDVQVSGSAIAGTRRKNHGTNFRILSGRFWKQAK